MSDSEDDFHMDAESPEKNNQSNSKESTTIPTIQLKAKQRSKPFDEDLLLSAEGLRKIQKEFPKRCKLYGKGREKDALKQLMASYQEWSFQLHPGISTADALLKCESMGSSARVKNHMKLLRDHERNQYLVSYSCNALKVSNDVNCV